MSALFEYQGLGWGKVPWRGAFGPVAATGCAAVPAGAVAFAVGAASCAGAATASNETAAHNRDVTASR